MGEEERGKGEEAGEVKVKRQTRDADSFCLRQRWRWWCEGMKEAVEEAAAMVVVGAAAIVRQQWDRWKAATRSECEAKRSRIADDRRK